VKKAVGWSRDHIDETAAIVVSEAHGDPAHATRALHDLFGDDITPVDLRISAAAPDEVIASARQAGLVADDAPLGYQTVVDDSFT
jgi:hypothetical protein